MVFPIKVATGFHLSRRKQIAKSCSSVVVVSGVLQGCEMLYFDLSEQDLNSNGSLYSLA